MFCLLVPLKKQYIHTTRSSFEHMKKKILYDLKVPLFIFIIIIIITQYKSIIIKFINYPF